MTHLSIPEGSLQVLYGLSALLKVILGLLLGGRQLCRLTHQLPHLSICIACRAITAPLQQTTMTAGCQSLLAFGNSQLAFPLRKLQGKNCRPFRDMGQSLDVF